MVPRMITAVRLRLTLCGGCVWRWSVGAVAWRVSAAPRTVVGRHVHFRRRLRCGTWRSSGPSLAVLSTGVWWRRLEMAQTQKGQEAMGVFDRADL